MHGLECHGVGEMWLTQFKTVKGNSYFIDGSSIVPVAFFMNSCTVYLITFLKIEWDDTGGEVVENH